MRRGCPNFEQRQNWGNWSLKVDKNGFVGLVFGTASPGRFRFFQLRGPSVRKLCEATSNCADAVLLVRLQSRYTTLLKACDRCAWRSGKQRNTGCRGTRTPTSSDNVCSVRRCLNISISLTTCTDSQSLLKATERRSPVSHHLRSSFNA